MSERTMSQKDGHTRPRSDEPTLDPGAVALYKWSNVIVAVSCGLIGVYMIVAGFDYGITRNGAIGSGFFPMVLGSIFVLLTLIWLAIPQLRTMDDTTGSDDEESELGLPDRSGFISIGGTIVACGLFMYLLPLIGYQLTMSLFVVTLLKLVAHTRWVVAAAFGIAFGFGTFAAFVELLGVPLPAASLLFLNSLGL